MAEVDWRKRLSEPFPAEDIEWRVSRAGMKDGKVWCRVFAYITARGIEERLDDVFGVQGWQLTQPVQYQHGNKCAIGIGIKVFIEGKWITKWDVCELTDSNDNIPPFKGAVSGAIKRSGSQLGIGRYLYHVKERYAEVSLQDPRTKGWNYAKLSAKQGGTVYYWKAPQLPSWALPPVEESEVSADELNLLKLTWKKKFAGNSRDRSELSDGFARFVESIVGEFPASDHKCWSQDALRQCMNRINETTDPNGVSSDVPFDN